MSPVKVPKGKTEKITGGITVIRRDGSREELRDKPKRKPAKKSGK